MSRSVDRLTSLDRLMLGASKRWPQDIGALVILDGTILLDPAGELRIGAVREAITSRLHLVPRLRQVIHAPGRGLGGPLWVDAPRFDIRDHVVVRALPPGAGETGLLAVTEELRSQRFDPSRPLWRMWFLPGLPDGRVAMFVKLHHSIADGMAAMTTIAAFLDADPDAPITPASPWTPAPPPSDRELLTDNAQRHLRAAGHAGSMLVRPGSTLRHARQAWPAIRELLRAVLRRRGEPVEGTTVRAYVPVSLRPRAGGPQQGNQIAQMAVPLAMRGSDAGDELRRIAAETATRKMRARTSLGTLIRGRLVRRLMLFAVMRQRVNVTTASIPGPVVPLYLAGARVLEVFPVPPLIANEPLGVGALSYAGAFSIGVVADRDAYPDLDVFVAGAREELDTLGVSAHPVPALREVSHDNHADP
jgi:diacylglycerol O-acyltransferase / wax synthase